ncbi:MAG: cytochrome b N-terminal domain-containing protein [Myxococcales bacterium]|nr:cytochrome b N-terminal domain-containing protein [Myxococcales bacterium]
MLSKIADFLDDRTGYRALLHEALDEDIAGGARWAYVFGSGLLTIFACQVVTGLLLMATYTPSMDDAWSSVFYIQHKVTAGWFIRGLHHYGSQAMMIVLGFHLLQVALYGAYKKPREVTWWVGLGLMGVVQALGLTGYLLPWDQKGYWATKVATNIAGTVPLMGPALQTLIVGGAEYGQATITRFYVLHVGVLPATLVLLVSAHVALFRRNGGATPPASADLSKKGVFYPDQVVRDLVFALLVVGVMALLTVAGGGAHIDAPADPSIDYHPRPEWYFLFLFQLLKYLPGSMELLGTVILPGLAGAFLFVLPFLDRGESTAVRGRLPWLAPILLGALGVIGLTYQAFADDAADEEFQAGLVDSQKRADRAIALAQDGIPPGGPLEMLKNDPMTRGADVYAKECTSCHVLDGEGERSAPDHSGYGSRKWLMGLLLDPDAEHYFGTTELSDMKPMGKLGDAKLKAVIEYLISLGHETGDPAYDLALAKRGKRVFEESCFDCHAIGENGADIFDGPNMTGYGSSEWIFNQIKQPDAETQYGELNEMPVFAGELDDHDIRMVTAYLRRQRLKEPPFEPKAPAPKADAGVESPED